MRLKQYFQRTNIKKYLTQSAIQLIIIAIGFTLPAYANANGLKMIVTAAFVSEQGMPIYESIADYLSKKLTSNVEVVSGISYEESDLLLNRGIVQLGFICGLPYTREFDKNALLAIPVMAGKKGDFPDTPGYENVPGKYFSYTIVRKDSPISSWQELKGKSFAYNDQNSNSGYNMPRYKLIQLGAKSWEDYFSRIEVSGSHEESIRMVAQGLVDASSVDSMVLDYDRHLGNKYAMNVKVIEVLFPGGAGIPPVVLSKKANPALKQEIQNALLNMHKDKEGRKILDEALIKYFAPPDDSNYNDIRKMDEAAKQVGFKDHIE
ncbi:MAG: PhnD/SsuA/transferrin family substrate-binding protein [Gammaproteobacteria bacterium]|nr:PhnD/SsuA/transferrin family substrate-binding protein [Gammaproteobacteria bacterium]